MLGIFERIAGGSSASGGPPTHVIALKWNAFTRAERDEYLALESPLRNSGVADLHFDNVECGARDVVFWLHTSNPKRAFKELTKLPFIAEHLDKLQAACAARDKLKFSPLWPK